MNPAEENQDEKHQQPIEYPHERFMSEEVSVIPLSKLNNSEDRPDKNQRARNVECVQMFLPRKLDVADSLGRVFVHTCVEFVGNDDEEAEDDDLDDKTGDNNVLACLHGAEGAA